MPEYRHYEPVIEFDYLSATSEQDAQVGWAEYIVQCPEALFEMLCSVKMIDRGPCPDEDGVCGEE